MKRSLVRFRSTVLLVFLTLAGTCEIAQAQAPAAPQPPGQTPPGQSMGRLLPAQQLDNLVAPIALYPDPLLGQMLVAATYPVELVEAQQWLEANGNLRGAQLTDAARQQNWDASVQALVAIPDALTMLTQDIRWTTDLGNAFLAQQADVMNAVQRMRVRAQANGQLKSTPQETVTTENQGGQTAVEIEPANPQTIYVPAYDPYYVYGYGDYPPLFYPDGYWFEPGINIGFCFGGWGGWGFGGWGWGWGLNWFGRGVFVNNGFFNRYGYRYGYGFAGGIGGRTAWAHDPAHRLGAGYPAGQLSGRFGAASQASRIAAGQSGNWHTFSGNNTANRSSFGNGATQAGARSFQNSANSQRFAGSQFRGGPAQAAAQRYQAPATRGYAGSAYQAPQRSFQSAPRMSSPGFGGGGGGSRSFGGGSRSGGGGSHGGGRR